MFIETNNETTGPDDEEEREEDSDEDGVSMLAHTLHHNHITWDNLTLFLEFCPPDHIFTTALSHTLHYDNTANTAPRTRGHSL